MITQQNCASTSQDPLRVYLLEIGRFPLLRSEQEIVLGKQVQKMMTLLAEKEQLELRLGVEPSLKEWAEQVQMSKAELNRVLQQGKRAKKKMIEANLRLVVSLAKKYQNRNMEFLDLIQEGNLGLERGVEKFDVSKGYRFSTYAKGVDSSIDYSRFVSKVPYYSSSRPHNRKSQQNQENSKRIISTVRKERDSF